MLRHLAPALAALVESDAAELPGAASAVMGPDGRAAGVPLPGGEHTLARRIVQGQLYGAAISSAQIGSKRAALYECASAQPGGVDSHSLCVAWQAANGNSPALWLFGLRHADSATPMLLSQQEVVGSMRTGWDENSPWGLFRSDGSPLAALPLTVTAVRGDNLYIPAKVVNHVTADLLAAWIAGGAPEAAAALLGPDGPAAGELSGACTPSWTSRPVGW